jgi:hypothetical protein
MSEDEYYEGEFTDAELDAMADTDKAYSSATEGAVEEQPLNEPEAAEAPKWQIHADIVLERATDLRSKADNAGAEDISRRLTKVIDALCLEFDRLDELEYQLAHPAD